MAERRPPSRRAVIGGLAALAAASIGARAAAAPVEVIGVVDATLDGAKARWYATMTDVPGRSVWSGDATSRSVTLFGNASASALKETKGALVLQFDMLLGDGGAHVPGPSIRLLERGFSTGYVALNGQGAEVRVGEQRVLDDGSLLVRGSFAGSLGYTTDFGARIDGRNPRRIDGTFEAVLPRKPGS